MSRASQVVATSAAQVTPCSHCGLPSGVNALIEDHVAFCCSGCRTVYFALRSAGLEDYYSKREGTGNPARQTGGDYAHFDDPGFLDVFTKCEGSERSVELYLEGVHCAACLWLIEKLPNVLAGVVEAKLSFGDNLVRVRWLPEQVSLGQIADKLDSFGYPPHPSNQAEVRLAQDRTGRNLLAKIGIAGATFGNVMLLSFALYSGEFSGMTKDYAEFFRAASLLITVPSVMWTASSFFRGALGAIRTRTPHMDLPISVGILAALVWGVVETLRGGNKIYFDSVTMLVFLLLIGRYIQAYQTRAARSATDLLFALSPSSCRVKGTDGTRIVPASFVERHALVEVLAGDRIGIDGEVVHGSSCIDESLLTGESSPKRASEGTLVHAGTINLSGTLEVRALRTGRETRLAQLVRDVEIAAAHKAPIVMLADRLAGYFVFVALGLALVTYWIWRPIDPHRALDNAIALLIVTCPCALGMATPLAAGVALGRAARQGILVKGMRFLEQFSAPGLIVFDKTGTLTAGQLRVVDMGTMSPEIVALVRAAEQRSSHPISVALQRDLPLAPVLDVTDFEEIPGQGVRARVNGRELLLGNATLIRRLSTASPDDARSRELLSAGLSPVYVVVDGILQGSVGLGDPPRPEARACLSRLQRLGYRLAILSGDRQELVDEIVAQVSLPFEFAKGEQGPEQKLAFVSTLREGRNVYMVGDGVNDAAALTACSVGIAMSGGAEASIAAADVFSTRAGLVPVLELALGARRTLRVIRTNIAFSLGYNLLAAGLCLFGVITPLLAAILMPLSSLTVVTNSLRAKTFCRLP